MLDVFLVFVQIRTSLVKESNWLHVIPFPKFPSLCFKFVSSAAASFLLFLLSHLRGLVQIFRCFCFIWSRFAASKPPLDRGAAALIQHAAGVDVEAFTNTNDTKNKDEPLFHRWNFDHLTGILKNLGVFPLKLPGKNFPLTPNFPQKQSLHYKKWFSKMGNVLILGNWISFFLALSADRKNILAVRECAPCF